MRRTKIVCTIGPASRSEEMLEALIAAGMDVARLNFSHGSHAEHREVLERIRALAEKSHRPVGVLQDLGGPKIRVGAILTPSVVVRDGETLLLTPDQNAQDEHTLHVVCPRLLEDVHPGARVLISDGAVRLRVLERVGRRLRCEVIVGGSISSHMGVNVPDSTLGVPALTDKDRLDLSFGVAHEVDWVALSFVRRPEDVQEAKALIRAQGSDIPLIAKIEKREALEHLDGIIEAADGIMVARGDLGVEVDLEDVPIAQKRIIGRCRQTGRPVITATQMLDSMREHPYPTRAEVSDVANAILDGTDAVMLSQETAVGAFPTQSVEMMVKIAEKTEASLPFGAPPQGIAAGPPATVADAVSHATCQAAHDLHAAAIITCTMSGSTARKVARCRPSPRIIAATPNPKTLRRLCLSWGVNPVRIGSVRDTDDMTQQSVAIALQNGWVTPGDRVVITAGVPLEVPGTTNLMKVQDVSD